MKRMALRMKELKLQPAALMLASAPAPRFLWDRQQNRMASPIIICEHDTQQHSIFFTAVHNIKREGAYTTASLQSSLLLITKTGHYMWCIHTCDLYYCRLSMRCVPYYIQWLIKSFVTGWNDKHLQANTNNEDIFNKAALRAPEEHQRIKERTQSSYRLSDIPFKCSWYWYCVHEDRINATFDLWLIIIFILSHNSPPNSLLWEQI